jgi:hypothetical protein
MSWLQNLFGKSTEKRKEYSIDEYVNTSNTIANIIQEDADAIESMKQIFLTQYSENSLSNKPLQIGSGDSHVLYSVNSEPITHESTSVYLALRLGRNPYDLSSEVRTGQLLKEVSSFLDAYERRQNPSKFTNIVQWKSPENKIYAGILTQDFSERKTLPTTSIREVNSEFLSVTHPNGKETKHFIDKSLCLEYNTNAWLILQKKIELYN